ncbi:G5.2 [Tranosema rostrale ichnovirus]|nr:G5.2 [Tranosema rostrale ichnovirus]
MSCNFCLRSALSIRICIWVVIGYNTCLDSLHCMWYSISLDRSLYIRFRICNCIWFRIRLGTWPLFYHSVEISKLYRNVTWTLAQGIGAVADLMSAETPPCWIPMSFEPTLLGFLAMKSVEALAGKLSWLRSQVFLEAACPAGSRLHNMHRS